MKTISSYAIAIVSAFFFTATPGALADLNHPRYLQAYALLQEEQVDCGAVVLALTIYKHEDSSFLQENAIISAQIDQTIADCGGALTEAEIELFRGRIREYEGWAYEIPDEVRAEAGRTPG
jgi:hypothetical protein